MAACFRFVFHPFWREGRMGISSSILSTHAGRCVPRPRRGEERRERERGGMLQVRGGIQRMMALLLSFWSFARSSFAKKKTPPRNGRCESNCNSLYCRYYIIRACILSYPILSYPIVSHPVVSYSNSATYLLTCLLAHHAISSVSPPGIGGKVENEKLKTHQSVGRSGRSGSQTPILK